VPKNLATPIPKPWACACLSFERMDRLACHAMLACATALAAACAGPDARRPVLRPIDAVAMQGTVERLAKEMLVPGAVVILRTPNGDFATTYGVTTYRCDEERLPLSDGAGTSDRSVRFEKPLATDRYLLSLRVAAPGNFALFSLP
jgi:hypothetical protein